MGIVSSTYICKNEDAEYQCGNNIPPKVALGPDHIIIHRLITST
jgi:hypothetical protein